MTALGRKFPLAVGLSPRDARPHGVVEKVPERVGGVGFQGGGMTSGAGFFNNPLSGGLFFHPLVGGNSSLEGLIQQLLTPSP